MDFPNFGLLRSVQELSRGAPVSAGRHRTPGLFRTACICMVSALSLSVMSVWRPRSPPPGSSLRGPTPTPRPKGAILYEAACAVCHLTDFQGSFEAPELAGPNFRNTWGGRGVSNLLVLIAATMPPEAAGSLSAEQVASVVAYLLRANEVQAGGTELSLASTVTVIPGAEPAAATTVAGIPPIPGRVGTIRSPDTRQAPPEFLGAISETPTGITETYRAPEGYTPVSNAELASPPDGDWLHWRGSPGSTGFSPLSQINTENVHRLQLAWVWRCPMDAVTGPHLSRDPAFSS